VVIALGGNALINKGEKGTFQEQMRNVERTAREIARIIDAGHHVVITHGNGPQVGNLLIQQDAGRKQVPPQPMHVCGAMSQGQIGYMLQQALGEATEKQVVTVITQVLVDRNDPAFKHPTKFVGPFYKTKRKGMVWDAGRGYRKVVPSPEPKRIIEAEAIKALIKAGVIVIASGGGGIPVEMDDGRLRGIDAVIDKDLAAALLAETVGAKTMLILTAVPEVFINYGKANQTAIRKIKEALAQNYLSEGHFPPGNMGPKIEAAVRFLRNGGKRVVITSPELAWKGFLGEAGTEITR
jgi:carbamate kinase